MLHPPQKEVLVAAVVTAAVPVVVLVAGTQVHVLKGTL